MQEWLTGSGGSSQAPQPMPTLAPAELDSYDLKSLALLVYIAFAIAVLARFVFKFRTHFRKLDAKKRHKQTKNE